MNFLNFKHSFRNLGLNRIYTLINLAGLGISGAFILLIALYVRHALIMDKYSANLKNIYRIESADRWSNPEKARKTEFFDWLAKDAGEKRQLVTPIILAEDLKKNFPEVKDFCRINSTWEPVIVANDQKFSEDSKHVAYADRNFFSFFGLPVIDANAQNAFTNTNSVVISER